MREKALEAFEKQNAFFLFFDCKSFERKQNFLFSFENLRFF